MGRNDHFPAAHAVPRGQQERRSGRGACQEADCGIRGSAACDGTCRFRVTRGIPDRLQREPAHHACDRALRHALATVRATLVLFLGQLLAPEQTHGLALSVEVSEGPRLPGVLAHVHA